MKGIVEAQLVSDMPGRSEIRDRGHASSFDRPRIDLVAQIGARFAAKNGLVIAGDACVTARVAYPPGQIEVLPVIRLYRELFGRRICSRASVIQIAVQIG